MSFLDKLSAFLPLGKKERQLEYFFALNIGVEKLAAALWAIEDSELKILEIASEKYVSNDDIARVTDKLLDQVLGLREVEPQKILFGVPNSWILDENLKETNLKILRSLVKELGLTPMAYVATSNALMHFLEKQEGVPTTAIIVGIEENHLVVTVVRAGKLDGVKVVERGETAGLDIEKALLTFTDVETLPSRILIYGAKASELKPQLLSFSWMSKLSFLHFPKIDILEEDLEIKSVCLAGASEMNDKVSYENQPTKRQEKKTVILEDEEKPEEEDSERLETSGDNFGFVVGDVSDQIEEKQQVSEEEEEEEVEGVAETELVPKEERNLETDDFEKKKDRKLDLKRFLPKSFPNLTILIGITLALILLLGSYIFLPKADVKIYVEPRILEKDAQVIADPKQKEVNEEGKIIPGQTVETEVTGSSKDTATGKKQVGDPAKGTVVVRNKTDGAIILSKGTVLSNSSGLKFSLDLSVTIASRSADDGTWGKATATVTAQDIGADGNLSSGVDLTVVSFSTDKIVAKSEGNFSGGTSKDVTVVSDADQKKLLAQLAGDLRRQAQQKLQEKEPNKKILEEGLLEEIVRKSYSKNINDQAGEFSLNLTVRYKGTAFEDKDLKLIVSKLVTTQVPDGFTLDLAETETQADVSKLEKDGRLIFLARFKAKLLPKIDTEKIKNQIRFKTPFEVANILKGMENVLGSEIKISPNLPEVLKRLPVMTKNIKIEVGLK